MKWTPLLWLAVTLALLLLVERWIHRHLQGIMLLLTGDPHAAVLLYALPLLPGIIIHEFSHALAAILLGVRVGRMSIRPKLTGRRVQLGFVPVEKTDVVRASLIGLAPLVTGSAVVLLIGYGVFDVGAIGAALTGGDWANLAEGARRALDAPDAWLWAYVVFAVSNTMVPSRADRQAWTPVLLFLLAVGVAIWVAGLGPAVVRGLADPLDMALGWLVTMCALTIAVDVPFMLAIALGERLVGRLKGLQVDY
jgi:hypothetical protein